MPRGKFSRLICIALLTVEFSLCVPQALAKPKFKILHGFSGKDGAGLWGNLILDKNGNLYGPTGGGGPHSYGTVFKLTPKPDGKWTHTILHSFDPNDHHPFAPHGGMVFDSYGNLYGTTEEGGPTDYGTVFELEQGVGGWTFRTVHSFNFRNGAAPWGTLAIDSAGNLYGEAGVIFKLSQGSKGWRERVLYLPPGTNLDGPIRDQAGNLYGTTENGGAHCLPQGCGTVYEVMRMGGGKWQHRILHSFGAFRNDGISPPEGQLAIDQSGSLYGTTFTGGTNRCVTGCGTIFKLTPDNSGHWKETILYNFRNDTTGNGPAAGVVVDGVGNIYGTTMYGGSPLCGCGVVYKLAPTLDGKWQYKVLHRFLYSDGAQPAANLILDKKGNLYGTTPIGGPGGLGVVFEITP